jgi:3-hydroxyisobutyrate dehydrogenase
MGRAIAGRLLEGGHQVTVWNRSAGGAGELVSAGAHVANSVADAAGGAEIVVTALANDDAVRSVALGEDGLLANIGAAQVYADCSTVSPDLSDELEQAFLRFAATPVLGSPTAVRAGQATYLAGGRAPTLDALAPMLASLTGTVRRYERASLASAAKLTSNLLLLFDVVGLAEAFTVGRSGGLSDDQLRELLGESALVAPAIKNRFEGVLTGSLDGWWTTTLGAKDGSLALAIAARAGINLPAARAVYEVLKAAADAGDADEDIVAVARRYRPAQGDAT